MGEQSVRNTMNCYKTRNESIKCVKVCSLVIILFLKHRQKLEALDYLNRTYLGSASILFQFGGLSPAAAFGLASESGSGAMD